MLKYIVFIILITNINYLSAHKDSPQKIIVDTDMGLDDIRALAILLQSDHVEVKAIIASEGASTVDETAKYISIMLKYFGQDSIPVFLGHKLNNPAPFWRDKVRSLNWKQFPILKHNFQSIYKFNFNDKYDETYVYVALGPLTNFDILQRFNSNTRDRIASIYFASYHKLFEENWQHQSPLINKFNIDYDSLAAFKVFNSQIPIYCFNLSEDELPIFTCELIKDSTFNTPASIFINKIYDESNIQEHLCGRHPYYAYDEIIALYLDEPYIGSFEMFKGDFNIYKLKEWNKNEAISLFREIMSGNEISINSRETVTFKDFFYNAKYFKDDIIPFVDNIINKFGQEEWKAVILTNELHRHLGIYSIIGAKMGIRAREILHADLDDIILESHAGLVPPLSCLNDGLQVSTGASLGRGSITILENKLEAKALFKFKNKILELSIKPELVLRIRNDVQSAGKKFGFQSKEYFAEIRRLSVLYWLELDRNKIFNEYLQDYIESN